MITTSTGAKKLESSDNWREIFPNPGTSAAGAHNASVDAQDRIQAEVAPIINGKRCAVGAASGEYVLLRNSTTARIRRRRPSRRTPIWILPTSAAPSQAAW